jgi:hypothetical protein
MNTKNLTNGYVESVRPELFASMPKTVWAAVAVSSLTCGGDHLDHAQTTIDECGQPGHVGHDSAGTYRAWAEHVMRTQGWLGYIVGHSNCNPWTAVAAMLAMWYAAKRFGMVVAP